MFKNRRLGRPKTGPVRRKLTKDSVWLCGRYINLHAIARSQAISVQYVSYIVNGEREGRLNFYIKIAGAIGVGLEELLAGIEERKQLRLLRAKNAIGNHNSRVTAEDHENWKRKKAGKAPIPPIPAFRLPSKNDTA